MRKLELALLTAALGAFTPLAASAQDYVETSFGGNVYAPSHTEITEVQEVQAAAAGRPFRVDVPRLRFGVDGGIGVGVDAFSETSLSWQGGIRFGLQANDFLGVYYMGRGIGAAQRDQFDNALLLGIISNGGGFDVTMFHLLQVGAGISADWVRADTCGNRSCFIGQEGSYFGFDVRAAFTVFRVGSHYAPQRNGLTLGVSYHGTVTNTSGIMNVVTANAGWEIY